MYSIEFNDISSKNMDVEIVRRPSIPSAIRNVEEQTVPGMNGSVFFDYNTYQSITIEIEMNFKTTPNNWNNRTSEMKQWIVGQGKLYLSDMQSEFYKVKRAYISKSERSSKNVGTFTAYFVCDPFKYSDEGQELINNPGTLTNSGFESEPLFLIAGSGLVTLTVNDNSVKANISDGITIDVEKEIAYRDTGELSNISVSGDYGDLKLKSGTNVVAVSEGFTLKMIPRWRRL